MTNQGKVCISMICPKVLVNEWFWIIVGDHNITFCIFNVTKVEGCDFSFVVPMVSTMFVERNFALFTNVEPIPIGLDIS